ncbi:unnamed protein product [Cuscuta epithymum]|uniref:Uncharacterized protein n=1 Tax=Cuscuta epithymum TaxID=186058 RepID=A0AAV0GI22_9ASTE|nr:unnamed protein product [Cuscuta epithymum]
MLRLLSILSFNIIILVIIMSLKVVFSILWLSLALLFLHEFYSYNNNKIGVALSSSNGHRKTLASHYDFTPFDRRRQQHSPEVPGEARGREVDPRYGVDKRLVPSGPNPLHN